jgi:16S rRNA (guanine527-N7)-methyltransferase
VNKDLFVGQLNSFGISVDNSQVDLLFSLLKDTLEVNEKFNLTAIKDEDQFLEKMILDSALGLIDLDLKDKEVIDIGTGAGFPGMVIKILSKESKVTLLDSTNKKIEHLKSLEEAKQRLIKKLG